MGSSVAETAEPAGAGRRPRRTCIRTIWIAAAAITLARLAYNAWLSPYELVADEAQYWDWARRLDWSYYSKGPGIAWLIAGATRALGHAEWAVRAPASAAFGVVMLALSGLTLSALGHHARGLRAASLVPVIVTLVPAYQLSALLMTIDAPYLACWALALCAGWEAYRYERDGEPRAAPWMLLGASIGVGFLFKYTALLVVPGLIVFAWLERRAVPWRTARFRALGAAIIALSAMLPVFVWNARHDAATLRHLLGYLAATGGDRPVDQGMGSLLLRTAEYPLVQLVITGPAIALSIAGGLALGRRRDAGPERAFARFAACTAAPMLGLFLVLSLAAPIGGNWPIAAFLSLVPLAAVAAVDGGCRGWWRGTAAYGLTALLVIHCPLAVARAPVVGRFVPVSRFRGSRDAIQRLAPPVREFLERSAGRGLIVAPSHNHAGLLAYYLPMHPVVASAGRFLGDRPSAYDFFSDTDLTNPALVGRPALFVGGTAAQWTAAFRCPDLGIFSPDWPQLRTARFGGVRTAGTAGIRP